MKRLALIAEYPMMRKQLQSAAGIFICDTLHTRDCR
jgi:hypothetical protein